MTDEATEAIRVQAERLQKIAEDCVEGTITLNEALILFESGGASSSVAGDYVTQITNRQAEKRASDKSPAGTPAIIPQHHRESTPAGLSPDQIYDFREERERLEDLYNEELERRHRNTTEIAEATAWAVLRNKVSLLQSGQPPGADVSADSAQQIATLLGLTSAVSTSAIPTAVLDAAPHLSLLASSTGNTHLDTTWKLRQAFSGDKTIDPLVDLMQRQRLDEPIPRSIWKEIIQDRFVNFHKLYAAMEPGYDHQDELKDFHGGYALVRKDHAVAKKPVLTEAEWSRVFGTWEVGVGLLFPHRKEELRNYTKIVRDLFRAVPANPLVAINFDIDVRGRYAKEPFLMDDRTQVNIPLFAQMFNSAQTAVKRSAPSSMSYNPKRINDLCINWNFDNCQEPCPGRRKHGDCSECGGRHRAKDVPSCYSALQAGKGKRAITGVRAGKPSSGGS